MTNGVLQLKRKKTIRILLISQENKLLLMRVVDPSTTGLDKKQRNAFWCTIGGKIEQGETLQQATYRELFEETGLNSDDVELGPIVWYGIHQMIISGQHVELDEKFIVVFLKSDKQVHQENFTANEKNVVTHTEWLGLDEILTHQEPIFPAIFKTHLADILAGKYPKQPLLVDLSLQPE